jgi:cobalt-zinc-cadmium efflux system membrane fusion protein
MTKADTTKGLRSRKWLALAGLAAAAGAIGLSLRSEQAPPRAEAASPAAAQGSSDRLNLPQRGAPDGALKTVKVERTVLSGDVQVVGSVSPAEDHYAVVGPSVTGRVVKLHVGVGDHVKKGQIMAEVDSVETGQARGEYIAAKAALAAAEANAVRETELAEKQISSNREREVAAAQAVSQRAKMRAALAHLRAIGLDAREVRALETEGAEGTLIPLRAPIDGTVIRRSVTLGQSVERSMDAFTVADLRSLWVMLDIYEKDLARVHPGQKVNLRTDAAPGELFQARVAYVDPVIDERTRTAHVRVEVPNPDGKFRLHQLVTARIIGDGTHAGPPVLAVPNTAVQRVEGTPIVFVRKSDGFERRAVEPGMTGGNLVEVRAGLKEGEEVAMAGTFLLKSELLR